jgi:tetratricopeptide (TPR) repeat protein
MMSKRQSLAWLLAFCIFAPASAFAQASADDDSERYATQGQQALAAGKYAEARTDFEQLAKLEPDVAEVHATLAVIYFKSREYEAAVHEVRTAQRLKPNLPKLDSLLAMSLSELGRYSEALPHLEKGFRQSADAEVRRMCGLQLLRAYSGLGRDADAVEVSLELNKLYPDDPEVLYHTGRIYGNFAYVVMEKLHDKAPGSIWMLQAQGEANESQKDYPAAIIAFKHVLDLEPHRAGIHYRLGRIYLARYEESGKPEDREAALREFTAELELDPGNGNAGYELANLHARMGNAEAAANEFQQVLARFPDFEEALVGLGGTYIETQKPDLAVAPLEHATQLNPDDEVAWYRLAEADRATGNRVEGQKAMAAFQKLHNSTPVTLRKPDEDEITPQQIGSGEPK